MALVDVAYIVKYPEPGRVKTRLAADIGETEAAQWYRQAASETFVLLRDHPDCAVTVSFDPPDQDEAVRDWLPAADGYLPQVSGDLGDRLRAVAERLWTTRHRPILFLGGDCPGIDGAYIDQAIAALRRPSHVIGPATDGGYVLLGLCGPVPEVFTSIPWSTDQVFQHTVDRLRHQSEALEILTPRTDVDTLSDLQKYEN